MDIIPAQKKNIILDATTLTSVMTCGRFANLRFDLNLGSIGGKSNSLESGSIVHKGLEIFYKRMIQGHNRQDAIQFGLTAAELYIKGCQYCFEFTPIICDAHSHHPEAGVICTDCTLKPKCGHPINEYPGVINTPPENTNKPQRIGWQWCLETLEQYFDFYKNDHWIPLEVEVVKRKILYEDDEIRILWKAKLDLTVDTNQGIYPCDHKTMKQNRDIVSLNNQFMGQATLMDTRNVIINKIGFQTTLKPAEKFKRVMVSYSIARLMEWQSEILPYWSYQLLSYQETGYYPPNFTQCEGKFGPCMFQKVCDVDPGMREETLKQDFVVMPKWDIDNVED